MSRAVDRPLAATETTAKPQSVFLLALKIGSAIALLHTLIDGLRIWRETPAQAYIIAAGGGAGASGLLGYRLSMLIPTAAVNLLLWFVFGLVVVFLIRKLKKA